MRVGVGSPWGVVDRCREIADGIWLVSTPGHGGFKLGPIRVQQIKAKFDFSTWAGESWYEEDCDAALVVVAFPECFSADEVSRAVKFVGGYRRYFGAVSDWVVKNFPAHASILTVPCEW